MRGGLGQLVDGLYGDDDFQKQIHGESSGNIKIKVMPSCVLKVNWINNLVVIAKSEIFSLEVILFSFP